MFKLVDLLQICSYNKDLSLIKGVDNRTAPDFPLLWGWIIMTFIWILTFLCMLKAWHILTLHSMYCMCVQYGCLLYPVSVWSVVCACPQKVNVTYLQDAISNIQLVYTNTWLKCKYISGLMEQASVLQVTCRSNLQSV